MSVTPEQIKFYLSTNGLGGAITNTEIISGNLHNLFDIVDKTGSKNGETNYRCFFVRNTNPVDTLKLTEVYIQANTQLATTSISIALDNNAIGSNAQEIPTENDVPLGVTFTSLVGEANSLTIGDIPPNSYKAIWVKRVVQPNTTASASDLATIRIDGQTL